MCNGYTNDKRPRWTHKIKEDLARWICNHLITKITHHVVMTSEDELGNFLLLECKHKDKFESRKVPTDFFKDNQEVRFNPDFRKLVKLSEEVIKTLRFIDAFESENDLDRKEYERLKRKFDTGEK